MPALPRWNEAESSAITTDRLALEPAALLRLLQLTSPALPVGAFAFSQGLETAVELGFTRDERAAAEWLAGILEDGMARLDLPVLLRLYRAWERDDRARVERWSSYLVASRESRERRLEDSQQGRALARLLADQGVAPAEPWATREDAPFACLFALGARSFAVPERATLYGFAFGWAENQVGALSRLVPLGQLAAQRVLCGVTRGIPRAVSLAEGLCDSKLGSCLPGLAIAGALHETQYTRLFKS